MNKIRSSTLFSLAIISSALFFFSIMFWHKYWSELWIMYGFIEIVIVVIFLTVLIKSLIFGISEKTIYEKKFVPFLICSICLFFVIILPLNWIRNRTNFFLDYSDYEKASAYLQNIDVKDKRVVKLPNEYQYLSVGGGEARINYSKNNQKVFLFYTYRGTPDGFRGFLKLGDGQSIKNFFSDTEYEIKNVGSNWYFISGE